MKGVKRKTVHYHDEATKKRIGQSVSQALKRGYAAGTIKPATGVGRGKYSYIIHGNKRYMFRSTYEFIFALYLIVEHIYFEVEAVRVPAAAPNRYASTFISDFSIGNRIIEIKGIPSGKDKHERAAFEKAGYIFDELFDADIQNITKKLTEKGYDVTSILSCIIDGHNSRCYFEYHI
jgi:hypothetical protein